MYIWNKSISILYFEQTWMILNPLFGKTYIIDGLHPFFEYIAFKCQIPRTKDEILLFIEKYGLESSEAHAYFDLLYKCGLLLETENTILIKEIQQRFGSVLSEFLLGCKSTLFTDYSSGKALADDEHRMRQYIGKEGYPPLTITYEGPKIDLTHPSFPIPTRLTDKIAYLLFWGFGKLREATFFGLHPVYLKAAPSNGARHPFEAFLICGRKSPFNKGIYHYNVVDHSLTFLTDFIPNVLLETGVILVISVCYERVQWRYRNSWAYQDLWFDLGHVICNLKEISNKYQLALTPVPVPYLPIHESLRLEGIRAFWIGGLTDDSQE
jgi:hypothetical protein